MTGDNVIEEAHALLSAVHPGWELPGLPEALTFALSDAVAGEHVLPEAHLILRALRVDPASVRVLIVGQDPYPTPGHPVGLAFSADIPAGKPLPKSLVNIFTEYESDLGLPRPTSGDLSAWEQQGVLLLNRVLTVRAGRAGSHQRCGWEQVTEAAVRQVAANDKLAAILWGKSAQSFAPVIGAQRCVQSPHPSPLSAYRGFFGSRPFSRANDILRQLGGDPVDWALTH